MDQLGADTFIQFEDDISDKSLADDDICITCRNISCLNASDEVDAFDLLEKRESFFDQCISLLFLCAVIYDSIDI